MQIQQLPEDVRCPVRLFRIDLGDNATWCLPDVDHVLDNDRSPTNCGDVSRLLLLQRSALHTFGAARRLDIFHTQDCLQGHVQWEGTITTFLMFLKGFYFQSLRLVLALLNFWLENASSFFSFVPVILCVAFPNLATV